MANISSYSIFLLGVLLVPNGISLLLPDKEPPAVDAKGDDFCNTKLATDNKFFCNVDGKCSYGRYFCLSKVYIDLGSGPCPAATPYCDNGLCVKDAPTDPEKTPAKCPPPPPDFICAQSGILPHPTNCKQYFYCPPLNSDGLTRDAPILYECPPLYTFDPALSNLFPCRLTRDNPAYCITSTISCQTSGGNQQLKYPYFPASLGQFGVYCMNNKPIVYKCGPNSQIQTVNYDTATEIYTPNCAAVDIQCSSDGQRFFDAADPDSYKVCYYNSNKYDLKSIKCPTKFSYNAKLDDCAPKGGITLDEAKAAFVAKSKDDISKLVCDDKAITCDA